MDKLLLIDGNSLINRAYFAFGAGGGLTFNGIPTNATYGFINMLIRAMVDLNPRYVAVAFDMRAKTFRHEMYDGYKANRKGMPDELAIQFKDLKKLLGIMNITIVQQEGFEADDVIGTLTASCGKRMGQGFKSCVLSADRDGMQLIDEYTDLYLTKTGVTDTDVWTKERVTTEIGIEPRQFIDVKALMGDKADNIPGAAGVGEKTALELIKKYGTLEIIYEHLDELTLSLRNKLLQSRDMVFLSRELARINTSVPIDFNLDDCEFSLCLSSTVYDEFQIRGFKSLCRRATIWADNFTRSEVALPEPKPVQTVIDKKIDIVEIRFSDEFSCLIEELKKVKKIVMTWDEHAYYFATSADKEYKVCVMEDLLSGGFAVEDILRGVRGMLESAQEKIVWDTKSLKQRLYKLGLQLNSCVVDIKIYEHLLFSTVDFPAPNLVARKYGSNISNCAVFFDTPFIERLKEAGCLELFEKIELPLVDVLIAMQNYGVKIDRAELARVSDELTAQIDALSEDIYRLSGYTFNINSPQQLGDVLFSKLGIVTTKKSKVGMSTSEAVLHKIASKHEIVPLVLRYRKLFKIYSTYLKSYQNLADEHDLLHSTFNNTSTVTGRLSSHEPNIQNIPTRSDDAQIVRRLFVSRFEGGKILSADYSQIELRLLAHFSGDEHIVDAFVNNRDIHVETACKVYGVTSDKVTHEMRSRSKAVNFGIIYGISSFGLADGMNTSKAEAAEFIEKYFLQFPSVKSYLDDCRDNAIKLGYATTLFGRRRQIPELKSTNHNVVGFGMRAAMNMPMQGSASDIIKKAMNELSAEISKRGLGVKMVAQIHDELIFDCPPSEIEEVSKLVKNIMENTVSLRVPLVVDIVVSDSLA